MTDDRTGHGGHPSTRRGAALALLSAGLFGASVPATKLLLGAGLDPSMTAGQLYLGSGALLLLFRAAMGLLGGPPAEAPLVRRDLPWLALVALFGGVLGPLLLLFGLAGTPAGTASLLLNLEGVATLTIAWLFLRESVDGRLLLGAGALLGGAALLTFEPGPGGLTPAALAVAGACLCWGIDNTLTRRISASDPVQIAGVKGLAAGAVNVAIAFARGVEAPPASAWLLAAAIGLLGYGVSLTLFVRALRDLGAARTGAYFATAPFLGAALSVALLGDAITPRLIAAAALMAVGVYLHLTERHGHEHAHTALTHSHRHTHDAHHLHAHGPDDPPGETHSHAHTHEPLIHTHPHAPDLHHRHGH